MEKVSIVIPCFEQAEYLEEAIESVLNQTYQNWECIIVNDGSQDDTEIISKKWCKKDSRIMYLYQENGGLSSARNFGIEKSNSDFILTLDADDKYHFSFIQKALLILKEKPEIGVVSSWVSRFKNEKEIAIIKPNGKVLEDFLFQNACNGTSLFRKVCWEKAGGYDENMKKGYEDWEFYIRVCKMGWEMYVLQETLFFYRQHAVSMRTDAQNNYDMEIKKYIYQKHEALYKEHYSDLIDYFLKTIALEKKQNYKIQNRIDYRIGQLVLKPFRFIKAFFRK
ncbi:glycosyltransferase family 2 protein [Flavobacterium agrisoli]|uniref:Glycosyltransferase family 2 protein n=1 Tax=Flavobacterium agrisoli TaxID=2793066 RepID=A0A934PQ18_9FLAO|nr:glycosyltransferase family A protein [Flavobacterium agrisoli]MBK0371245.1 glycosyltransferase family 2 protein [Flavobacterium agrisoli]